MSSQTTNDFSLLVPYLIFIIVATPAIILLLMRSASRTRAKAATRGQNTDGGAAVMAPAHRRDLLRIPAVKRLLKMRAFQFIMQLPNVIVFGLVIAAGIWGTQLGDKNFATVLTWLVWWAVIIFTFLFLSRTWCMACPLVSVAEWIQRGKLWGVSKRSISLNRKWPRKLRNFWIPTVFFIVLTWMFLNLELATNPFLTAAVALGLFIVPAILISLVFERRTFCRYVCPIGGVIGAYSMTAPLEIRNRSDQVCRSCKEKACYRGNEKGYGCPMFMMPQTMETNTYCTMCTECIKTCPNDNIALNVRPFLSDLWQTRKMGIDVAAIVVLMLGITVFQTLEMLQPWENISSSLQSATGLSGHMVLTLSFLAMGVIAPLVIFTAWSALTRWIGGNGAKLRTVFIGFSFAFLPIALGAHLAHNLNHFLSEGPPAVVPVISDPFGWGWNLFGTANLVIGPLLSMSPLRLLQMTLVALGYIGAVYTGWRVARQTFGDNLRSIAGLAPMLVLMIAFAGINLYLLNLPMSMRE
ncbi:MAG: 4Fe-4S binding protein [Thermoleophilia bacterium]